MIVSTRGRYALHVMLHLAAQHDGSYIPLKDIADAEEISQKYLASIMAVLSRAGLVDAVQGKGGGYRLSRAPETYTVGSILKLTEGSLAAVSCTSGSERCEKADRCKTLPMWEKLDGLIDGFLESITLHDLMCSTK